MCCRRAGGCSRTKARPWWGDLAGAVDGSGMPCHSHTGESRCLATAKLMGARAPSHPQVVTDER
eukprot:13143555-Alexandrium_andersonii.AAC.1